MCVCVCVDSWMCMLELHTHAQTHIQVEFLGDIVRFIPAVILLTGGNKIRYLDPK